MSTVAVTGKKAKDERSGWKNERKGIY